MTKFMLKLFLLVVALFLSTSDISAQKTPNNTSNTKKAASNQKVVSTPKAASSTKIDQEIVDEINFLRSNPQSYAKILEEMKSGIKSNIVNLPNGTRWQMNEGVSALDDAITELKKVAKLTPIPLSNGLAKVANIQLSNLQEDIKLGHFGKDGSDLGNRINRIGTAGERYSENIAYYSKDARSIILTMVIDDGLKSRSHRKNLLSTQFNVIGVSYGTGKNDVGLCVIVFADRFTEKSK